MRNRNLIIYTLIAAWLCVAGVAYVCYKVGIDGSLNKVK